MFYINYFKYSLLIFFLLSTQGYALSIEKECGEYLFEVKILNVNEFGNEIFYLYGKNQNNIKSLLYTSDTGVAFGAACVRDSKKRYYLLFQENCGGNGCPEDVYGIYDPRSGKLILNPRKWPNGNTNEVAKVIGENNTFFVPGSNKYFCCGYQIGKARGNF